MSPYYFDRVGASVNPLCKVENQCNVPGGIFGHNRSIS